MSLNNKEKLKEHLEWLAPETARERSHSLQVLKDKGLSNTLEWSLSGWCGYGRVIDVYDGDTLKAVLEFLPGSFAVFPIRVLGVNAAEIRASDDKERELAKCARDFVVQWCLDEPELNLGSSAKRQDIQRRLNECTCLVCLEVTGTDKYGRLLAHVRKDIEKGAPTLADSLLRAGLAKTYSL